MKKEDTHIDDIELKIEGLEEAPLTHQAADTPEHPAATGKPEGQRPVSGGSAAGPTPATDPSSAHAQLPTLPKELEDLATEEDGPIPDGVTLMKVLGGDFFNAGFLRRQIWLILLIAVFIVFYISNRYSCQKSMVEINRLNKELRDAKYKALSTSSELTERSRESRVLQTLQEVGDSTLKIASEPPYLINIKESNE